MDCLAYLDKQLEGIAKTDERQISSGHLSAVKSTLVLELTAKMLASDKSGVSTAEVYVQCAAHLMLAAEKLLEEQKRMTNHLGDKL